MREFKTLIQLLNYCEAKKARVENRIGDIATLRAKKDKFEQVKLLFKK